jgi:hypothetical protein
MEDAALIIGDGLRSEGFSVRCFRFRVLHAIVLGQMDASGQMLWAPMVGLCSPRPSSGESPQEEGPLSMPTPQLTSKRHDDRS